MIMDENTLVEYAERRAHGEGGGERATTPPDTRSSSTGTDAEGAPWTSPSRTRRPRLSPSCTSASPWTPWPPSTTGPTARSSRRSRRRGWPSPARRSAVPRHADGLGRPRRGLLGRRGRRRLPRGRSRGRRAARGPGGGRDAHRQLRRPLRSMGRVRTWMSGHAAQMRGDFLEVYVTDPSEVPIRARTRRAWCCLSSRELTGHVPSRPRRRPVPGCAHADLTLPEPRTPDPADAPPLRWGILAPGHIAGHWATALREHTRQQLVAVGSRSPERAAAFAARARRGPGAHVLRGARGRPRGRRRLRREPAQPPPRPRAARPAGRQARPRREGVHPQRRRGARARHGREARRACCSWRRCGRATSRTPTSSVACSRTALLGDVHRITADYGVRAAQDPTHRLLDPALAGRRAAGPGHLSPVVRLVGRARGRPRCASDQRPGRRLAHDDRGGRAGQRPDRLRRRAGAAVHVDAHRLRAHRAGVRLARSGRGGRPVLRPGRRHAHRRRPHRHVGRQPHPRLRRSVLPGRRARDLRRARVGRTRRCSPSTRRSRSSRRPTRSVGRSASSTRARPEAAARVAGRSRPA